MGHFGQILTLKLHSHFFESRNLIPCEFDVYAKSALEDISVPKIIYFKLIRISLYHVIFLLKLATFKKF